MASCENPSWLTSASQYILQVQGVLLIIVVLSCPVKASSAFFHNTMWLFSTYSHIFFCESALITLIAGYRF
jgi:hypothetical protein